MRAESRNIEWNFDSTDGLSWDSTTVALNMVDRELNIFPIPFDSIRFAFTCRDTRTKKKWSDVWSWTLGNHQKSCKTSWFIHRCCLSCPLRLDQMIIMSWSVYLQIRLLLTHWRSLKNETLKCAIPSSYHCSCMWVCCTYPCAHIISDDRYVCICIFIYTRPIRHLTVQSASAVHGSSSMTKHWHLHGTISPVTRWPRSSVVMMFSFLLELDIYSKDGWMASNWFLLVRYLSRPLGRKPSQMDQII